MHSPEQNPPPQQIDPCRQRASHVEDVRQVDIPVPFKYCQVQVSPLQQRPWSEQSAPYPWQVPVGVDPKHAHRLNGAGRQPSDPS